MRLCEKDVEVRGTWEELGYQLPVYNRKEMIEETQRNPQWIHFGPGNIFRALHANAMETLLNKGESKTGIIAVGSENVEVLYRPCDNYSILVTLKADGNMEKRVVGSIAQSFMLDSHKEEEFEPLKKIFANPSLQMATFTITEKGYRLTDAKGELLLDAAADGKNGPEQPDSYMGKIAALLYERYLAGAYPIAMVSTDNCSHNGDILRDAIAFFAKEWEEKGLVKTGFAAYISDAGKVSFPWTMIDKITPGPDEKVREILSKDGLEQLDGFVSSRNTRLAPFVNAEETEYLVIEDAFPNGRPALEKAGFLFTDRETVEKVEAMKVCTCLNPLHTALAVYGCLLGYDKMSEEMKDDDLRGMAQRLGYVEGLPVVVDPGILNPKEFIDTVIQVRIPNPYIPDTPQRIATDTSQKLAIRFGETIKKYQASGKDLKELKMIPLVFAGWLRYLMGVNDQGETFTLSPDPMLDSVLPMLEGTSLGGEVKEEKLQPILKDASIFGVDLYEAGLAETVLDYFKELAGGAGAVRSTLHKYVTMK